MKNSGISFMGVLAIVFITLKLLGTITWSWWWVTAPLWAGLATVLVGFVLFVIIAFIIGLLKAFF